MPSFIVRLLGGPAAVHACAVGFSRAARRGAQPRSSSEVKIARHTDEEPDRR